MDDRRDEETSADSPNAETGGAGADRLDASNRTGAKGDLRDRDRGAAEVVALLRRHRPVDPPPGLRERIVQAHRGEPPVPAAVSVAVPVPALAPVSAAAVGRAWPWVAAAAALLLCALGLRLGGDGVVARMEGQLQAGGVDPAAAGIASLAETLGGDDIAWRAASVMVRQEQEPRQDEGEMP